MADIRIERHDVPNGYVEVVNDLDPRYAAVANGVRDMQVIDDGSLTRTWFVTVGPAAELRSLRRDLVPILEGLEHAGEFVVEASFDQDLAVHGNAAVRALEAKGVVRLTSRAAWPGEGGKIQVNAVGTGGPVELDWTAFQLWLTDLLKSERLKDVRTKLAATGSPERHAFIGLNFTTPWLAYHALSDVYRDLPPLDPELPDEITHLWLCTQVHRCIAWFPDRGWFEPMLHWATA
ncbi:hypothetical protein [Dactylosporangium sucinum]|uniref:Uncharacterized protein n=1 Tax=Dactylosporangium sucinum TaxID=1424081 RepID=A0A917U1S1_9ACTN|nr:hypothetical protein GCM10007977_061100 [Dactylosporangium sucinum]